MASAKHSSEMNKLQHRKKPDSELPRKNNPRDHEHGLSTYTDAAMHGSRYDKTPQEQHSCQTPEKTSRFSLSKIGRSSTFTFRKKTKEKEVDQSVAGKKTRSCHKSCVPDQQAGHNLKSKPRIASRAVGNDCKRFETSCNAASGVVMGERGSACSVKARDQPPSRGDKREPRKKESRYKNTFSDQDNVPPPPWLTNPPQIRIQDFCSDYTDDASFYDEYFELVEWAFQVLSRQCCFSIQPIFTDTNIQFESDPQTEAETPLKVITTETARIGSAIDYILHPLSAGTANVINTGSKFADFMTRVWRGIHFDSFFPGSRHNRSPDEQK